MADEKTKGGWNEKAAEGLRLYRLNKEANTFRIDIDETSYITADKHQYILHQGKLQFYFVDLKNLLKHMITTSVRQSAVVSIQSIVDKLDELYVLIDKKFDGNKDPQNILTADEE